MATSKKTYHTTYIGLGDLDKERLSQLSKLQNRSITETTREAIIWYLDNHENLANDQREAEVAKAIRYAADQLVKAIRHGADRICKMLARQGIAVGTLYEITWMSLRDDESRKAFEAAMAAAKQKMRRHVERDEQEIADAMQKNLGLGENLGENKS